MQLKAILFLGLVWSSQLFRQESLPKEPISVEDEAYRVTLLSNTGYPECQARIAISRKQDGLNSDLSFRSLFDSVTELIVQKDRLLIMGSLPSEAGTNITVVDLSKHELQDMIWTWTYAFSPSGQYLAFTTFIARYEPAYSRRALVLVYDLYLDAAQNRLRSAGASSRENAGIPVYPSANLQQRSYDIFLEPHHYYLSDFLWSSDGSRFVFIDRVGDERFINVVSLKNGPRKAKLNRKEFDIMIYADYSKIPDHRRRELEERPTRFIVSTIEWEAPAEEKIRIELQAEEWLPENLVLELPDDNELGD